MDGDEGGVHCDRGYSRRDFTFGWLWPLTLVQQRSNLIIRSGRGGRCRERLSQGRAGGQAGQIVRVQVGREHVGCTVAHRCSRERGKAVEQVRRVLARAARVNRSSSRVEYESVGMM